MVCSIQYITVFSVRVPQADLFVTVFGNNRSDMVKRSLVVLFSTRLELAKLSAR